MCESAIFFACEFITLNNCKTIQKQGKQCNKCKPKCNIKCVTCKHMQKVKKQEWPDKDVKCGRIEHMLSKRQVEHAWCVRLLHHSSGCRSSLEMRNQRYSPDCWRSRVELLKTPPNSIEHSHPTILHNNYEVMEWPTQCSRAVLSGAHQGRRYPQRSSHRNHRVVSVESQNRLEQ